MKRLNRRILSRAASAAAMGAIAFCFQACQEPDNRNGTGSTAIEVTVISPDEFRVEGRRTNLKGLVRTVKAAGAKGDTPIRVAISEGFPSQSMSKIAAELATRGGFRRIVFARPQHVSTSAETASP